MNTCSSEEKIRKENHFFFFLRYYTRRESRLGRVIVGWKVKLWYKINSWPRSTEEKKKRPFSKHVVCIRRCIQYMVKRSSKFHSNAEIRYFANIATRYICTDFDVKFAFAFACNRMRISRIALLVALSSAPSNVIFRSCFTIYRHRPYRARVSGPRIRNTYLYFLNVQGASQKNYL